MKLPKPGTNVTVHTKDGLTLTGHVLPAEHLVLKLKNGYNVGVYEESITEVQS